MEGWLEFEKPITALEKELEGLRASSQEPRKIKDLEKKLQTLIEETYANLTPWQSVQVGRHAQRPHTQDYIDAIFPTFMELHGDRKFADDRAIVGGTALWPNTKTSVMIIGHQKGRGTKQKVETHFGMAMPEGVRKAIRLMELANRMKMPVITLVDTPGAYPGLDAEERGQAMAIAESIECMMGLDVPTIAVIIGEGGSGGALALAAADRVLMLQHSMYSVISPESAAAILWNNSGLGEKAAEKLKMFPKDLLKMKVIDGVIPEPIGGAHRNWKEMFKIFQKSLTKEFQTLTKQKTAARLAHRHQKFRQMGKAALVQTK